MSRVPSGFPAKSSFWKMHFLSLPALFICASSAWGAVPAVVIDSQQTAGVGYSKPQSIAVSKNGTVYIADTGNNQIIALTTALPLTGTNAVVSTGTYVLTTPQALALDANGDLFVGDTPTTGGRIIELLADGSGNLTGAAKVAFAGTPLTNPIALTVDSTGTLFIGDYNIAADPTVGSIFTLAPGGTSLTLLPITGLPAALIPAALVRDSSTNLYIADNGAFSGGVYIAPAVGGPAQPVATESFVINQPSGLALDAAGDLYILSLLGSGSGYNPGQQVVVVPAASPATPYILPGSGLAASSSMAFDQHGNLDVLESIAAGAVVQLGYVGPANMGTVSVDQAPGPPILFNFEFNAPTTLRGFRVVTQGDASTEVTQIPGGSCTNGAHNNLSGSGPTVSPYFPYSCSETYEGTPTYPGNRASSILVKGAAGTILASTPVYQTAVAGVEVTYPLDATITATNLQQPQAIAISGLNQKVYVADTLAGKVYSTNDLGGNALAPVSTGTLTLSSPSAIALDGAGNLFIADFDNADVIKVPTTTGQAPSKVNIPPGLLQHPIALALDYLGNLYIGDAGPGGVGAGNGNPGFVVKLPVGGAAFKMAIPSVAIVFPQSLATDPNTASLVIGDGGDPSGAGQVVQVSADGTQATVITPNNVTNPTGLAFDAGDELYVLDGLANIITVVPTSLSGQPSYQLPFDNSLLSAASALAISAGGQSFVIGNIGSGSSNDLVYLNGNHATLSFGSVALGSQSDLQAVSEYNIGNSALSLGSPFYVANTPNAAFTLSSASSCADSLPLVPSDSCTIFFQFKPRFIGQTTQQISIDSNAYNSGIPALTLRGTGALSASKPRDRRIGPREKWALHP